MRHGLGLAFGTGLFVLLGVTGLSSWAKARDLGAYLQRLLLWRRPEPRSPARLGM